MARHEEKAQVDGGRASFDHLTRSDGTLTCCTYGRPADLPLPNRTIRRAPGPRCDAGMRHLPFGLGAVKVRRARDGEKVDSRGWFQISNLTGCRPFGAEEYHAV